MAPIGFTSLLRGKIGGMFGQTFTNGIASADYFLNAGVPGAGFGAGQVPKGALVLDTVGGLMYQNNGTLAAPTYTAVSTVSGAAKTTADNLTAAAAGTKVAALALTASWNRVTTAASSPSSVLLPASSAGLEVVIINDAATNPIIVFGSGTDTIDGVANATGNQMAAAKRVVFRCLTVGKWISQAGAVTS